MLLMVLPVALAAQEPAGYYNSANGKRGAQLKTALHNTIKAHTQRSYGDLWTDFQTTDKTPDGKVWDMYSSCTFTFVTKQCGQYSGLCDCYNREHSFPKSWFDDKYPMYTDLFHLYPTDGWTNGKRSNFPFGEVGSVTWNGNNGSKLGSAKAGLGYTGTVFEPADEYKGDFARTYFYMVTCYENVVASWFGNAEAKPTVNGTAYPAFTAWQQAMLLKWHRQDPVSAKEINRNNAVYGIQHNRNPYIDHPELAEYVWGDSTTRDWRPGGTTNPEPQDTFYTVTFNARGGSPAFTYQTIKRGSHAVKPANPVRANHTFGTWVADTASSAAWNFTASVILSDLTLYATWTRDTTPDDTTHTAVGKVQEAEFLLYPNPVTNGQLTIDNEQWKTGEVIEIYSISGALAATYKITGAKTHINISQLPNGAYLLKVGKSAVKFVKQ